MRLSNSLKVTFVTMFSCLALMLGLFSSTGIASAHSAHTLNSQTSASQSAEQWRNRCRLLIIEKVVFVPRHTWWNNNWNNDWNNQGNDSWNNSWNNGWNNNWNNGFQPDQNLQFSEDTNGFDFNHDNLDNFNRFDENRFGGFFIVKVTEIRTCHGFRDNRFFQFDEN